MASETEGEPAGLFPSARSRSIQDIKDALPRKTLGISKGGLRRRLLLEIRMKVMMRRIIIFVAILVCYLFMLQYIVPPSDIGTVHQRLEASFHLSQARAVRKIHGIYNYVSLMQKRNERLHAASHHYWCEGSNFKVLWEPTLLQSKLVCSAAKSSRRLKMRPSNVATAALPQASTDTSQTARSFSNAFLRYHDRDVDDSNIVPANKSARRLHYITCNGTNCTEKPMPRYQRYKKFTGPLVTMMPVVVSQSRFEEKPCHGFADDYQKQGVNPGNFFAPGLDGTKKGNLTSCVDRTKHLSADYAFMIPCNESNTEYCDGGVWPFSPKYVHVAGAKSGEVVYPVLLNTGSDVEQLKSAQWLDAQTDRIVVSTLAYTEGLEVFTAVTVEFTFDLAGNVVPLVNLNSWKDLHGSYRANLIAAGVLAVLLSFFGSFYTIYQMKFETDTRMSRTELLTRAPVCFVSFIVMIWWSTVPKLAEKYEAVVTELKKYNYTDEDVQDKPMYDVFYQADTAISQNNGVMDLLLVLCFLVAILQILQLISYFHAHNGMAKLSSAAMRAWTNFAHLMTIMILLFLLCAFLVHWLFGDDVPAFATMGKAIATQLQMVYGDFLYAPQVSNLDATGTFMYWVYAMTFMVMLCFLFLDLFIAIVVDAFNDQQDSQFTDVATHFLSDLLGAFLSKFQTSWPDQEDIVEWIDIREMQVPDLETFTLDELHSASTSRGPLFDIRKFGRDAARDFIAHYCDKIPALLLDVVRQPNLVLDLSLKSHAMPHSIPSPLPQEEATRVLAQRAVREVAKHLADKDLSSEKALHIDWPYIAARLSCSFYRHLLHEGGLEIDCDDAENRKQR